MGALALFFRAEQASQRGQVQHLPLARAHHQSNIGHHDHDEHLQERERVPRKNGLSQHQAHQVGAGDAHDRADGGTDQPLQTGLGDARFKNQDCKTQS